MQITKENKIALFLFAGLFIYLLLRSYFVPFVSDEAGTFFFFIQNGKFIPPDVHWDANNHILNSALSYLSYQLFGPSPFALRLPNVLMFILYFYYLVKIAGTLSNKWLKWTFIISLAFVHNFIEFFALTRGYGMSMALLFAAIWYLMQVLNHGKWWSYLASCLFISLAILANLTLINTAIIFVFLLITSVFHTAYSKKKKISYRVLAIIFTATIVPMVLLIRLLFEYKNRGLLYYGTLDGFWDLSVRSLMKLLIESESNFLSITIIIYFIFILFEFIKQIIKSPKISFILQSKQLFSILFFANLTAVFILGYLMGINFPEDRTGMYFYPFFIATILFTLDNVQGFIKKKALPYILIPFLLFPIHFIFNINLSHSTLWIDEKIPPRFASQVLEDSHQNNSSPTIGGYRMRILTWAYLNYLQGGELNQVQGSHYPEYLSDYQVVIMKEEEDWKEYYDQIDFDSNSELSLLKRKSSLGINPFVQKSMKKSLRLQKKYHSIYKGSVDSIETTSLLINTSFKVRSDTAPLVLWLIAEVKNDNGEKNAYEFISLEWKKKQWKIGDDQFKSRLILYDLPADAKSISVYLWNIQGVEYEVEDIHIQISEVIEN